MNVCIKCGKLALAVDIYNSMKSVNCAPNVVTYNTLIDVYGKLSQWDKGLHVLDIMKRQVGRSCGAGHPVLSLFVFSSSSP